MTAKAVIPCACWACWACWAQPCQLQGKEQGSQPLSITNRLWDERAMLGTTLSTNKVNNPIQYQQKLWDEHAASLAGQLVVKGGQADAERLQRRHWVLVVHGE